MDTQGFFLIIAIFGSLSEVAGFLLKAGIFGRSGKGLPVSRPE
jgi:hypothetical protein